MEDKDRLSLLRSDLEEEAFTEQERHNVAQEILETVGSFLQQADSTLGDIENEGMMGSAIVRASQSLADSVGSIANELEKQTDDEYKRLARASIEDAQNSLLLQEEDSKTTTSNQIQQKGSSSELKELASMSEDDMVGAIRAASGLLRDVEETLRAIDQDEADEIADVALTVAHLFVTSLQSVHSTITPDDLLPQQNSTRQRSGVEIEMISPEEDDDTERVESKVKGTGTQNDKSKKQKNFDRLRVLWPPVGPAVSSAFDWGKEEASKKPILAVALGITLWPAAVMTAVFGAPLIADGFVQDLYNNFQDAPLIHGVERSAAQLFHTGKLTLICGKLVARQSLRVVSRQVKRHGGVGKIAQDAGGLAIDRITHPIETVGMCWNTVAWGAGALKDALDNLNDPEEDASVQDELQR